MPVFAAASVLLVGLAVEGADASVSSARSNPLRVGIVAASRHSSFLGAVDVDLTNTGSHVVRLPAWQVPTASLQADLFVVTLDGREVAYEGPMIKRGLPKAADFLILRPGQTVRTTVDLSAFYDLSRTGQYTVAFRAPLQHASLSTREMLVDANGLPMVAQSAALRLWVDGTDQLGGSRVPASRESARSGATLVDGVAYQGCSTSQIEMAGTAVHAARDYAAKAKGYLDAGTLGARRSSWFGGYTAARDATARQGFAAIDAALDPRSGALTINCGCNRDDYAFVYATRPYEIFVCRAFWSAPLTGTDSRGGTLIHEISHFDAVAGTRDRLHGVAGARRLAAASPDQALDNADNYEYFAESDPAKN